MSRPTYSSRRTMTPISPLTPITEPSSTSQQHHQRHGGLRSKRQNAPTPSGLGLPALPRFHPANFPSSHSSLATTPAAPNNGTPAPPMSPGSHQRQYHAYRREILGYRHVSSKPSSPRLLPTAGSPGPMTPLDLGQEQEGYFAFVQTGEGQGEEGRDSERGGSQRGSPRIDRHKDGRYEGYALEEPRC